MWLARIEVEIERGGEVQAARGVSATTSDSHARNDGND